MLSGGLVLPWVLLLCVMDGRVSGCECPQPTILAQFPSEAPPESCCLNYTGSTFGSVTWSLFSNVSTLEVLDLSDCNITHIQEAAASPAQLRELYLGRNALTVLPEHFLANATGLRVLDLGGNFLERLPEDFLRGTSRLRELRLDSNRLSALPRGVFQPSLEHLELSGNVWDCACPLVEELQGLAHRLGHWGNDSSWQGTEANLTCASPVDLAGRSVWSVQTGEACQTSSLTTLFILLPLLLLLALALCWCCGRKRKEGRFRPAKWAPEPAAMHRNGSERDRRQGHAEPSETTGKGGRDALLKNQLMLRPSCDFLSSSRDLYEEVEVKLGSADSLAPPPSEEPHMDPGLEARELPESRAGGDRPDAETVSVTEVMKDSADREKAYLAQSTEYYSLVPGMDLEDSDHCEYESVDLS